jgi:spermidine/putrescine-binding protein
VKQLYSGQAVTYTRDGRQLVEWAVRGTHPIALAAVQTNIEYFRKEGFKNIAALAMADGPGNVLGGFGVLKQAKGVPHPNAAQVFINWYASKPGQEVYSKVMLEPSRRTDVKVAEVPGYVIPVPGIKYLDAYDPEFYVKTRPKIQKQVIEALGGR